MDASPSIVYALLIYASSPEITLFVISNHSLESDLIKIKSFVVKYPLKPSPVY